MDRIITVNNYESLRKYYRTFNGGDLQLLIVTGRGGTGKSTLATGIVRDATVIDCHATAYGLYRQLYNQRNLDLILDDVDSLARDRQTVPLLKALCDTKPEKTIGWYSARSKVVGEDEEITGGLPDHFITTSRVIIISNDWKILNKNVAALNDRGIVLNFEPVNEEIHRHVLNGGWFQDQEILEFIQKRLRIATRLSMRDYVKALALKNGGMDDWRQTLLGWWEVDPLMELTIELMNQPGLTAKQRAEQFCQKTGKVFRTWYTYRTQYLAAIGQENMVMV